MKYFTDNPLERLMMQIPKPAREEKRPAPPAGHHCYGCSYYGEVCVFPCFRDIQKQMKETKKYDSRDK